MPHVIVLAGGVSDEREVSLRSGMAVLTALRNKGHTAKMLDPAGGLDKLLPELQTADAIFPALHGQGGEDGSLQRFLEAHNITFVGSGSAASELCFDKTRYGTLLQERGIVVPPTELVDAAQYRSSPLSAAPHVLKPNDGGSSVDTFIVRDPAACNKSAIAAAFEQHQRLVLQKLIVGTEITVGILGKDSLPVIEIIPPENQEFDYENKYNGATQELCPPEHVSAALQRQARELAARIHRLTGCRDMSRTDIMIDRGGELFVLETNTIPGLTGQSLLPKAATAAGYDMPALCDRLVRLALAYA